MSEGADRAIETIIREGWSGRGLPPGDLPPSDDPRMQALVAIVRQVGERVDAELARLQRREVEIEERVTELEARVQWLRERVGIGGVTLQ